VVEGIDRHRAVDLEREGVARGGIGDREDELIALAVPEQRHLDAAVPSMGELGGGRLAHLSSFWPGMGDTQWFYDVAASGTIGRASD